MRFSPNSLKKKKRNIKPSSYTPQKKNNYPPWNFKIGFEQKTGISLIPILLMKKHYLV